MSDALQKAIDAVPEAQWQKLNDESDAIRSCAEVAFVPGERSEKKDSQPLRYIAIRIEKKQGHLYDDGSRLCYDQRLGKTQQPSGLAIILWKSVPDVRPNLTVSGPLKALPTDWGRPGRPIRVVI